MCNMSLFVQFKSIFQICEKIIKKLLTSPARCAIIIRVCEKTCDFLRVEARDERGLGWWILATKNHKKQNFIKQGVNENVKKQEYGSPGKECYEQV